MKICDACGKACYSFATYKICRHIVCSRHEYPESCPVCAAQHGVQRTTDDVRENVGVSENGELHSVMRGTTRRR